MQPKQKKRKILVAQNLFDESKGCFIRNKFWSFKLLSYFGIIIRGERKNIIISLSDICTHMHIYVIYEWQICALRLSALCGTCAGVLKFIGLFLKLTSNVHGSKKLENFKKDLFKIDMLNHEIDHKWLMCSI